VLCGCGDWLSLFVSGRISSQAAAATPPASQAAVGDASLVFSQAAAAPHGSGDWVGASRAGDRARVFTVGAHFIPAAVKKINGLDLLGHTIRLPVI
jgi:hypothetical protein